MKMRRYRALGWAAYGVSILLILFPLLDSLLAVWPLHLEQGTWRFGAVGLFSRAVMTPLLGLLLGIGTAALFEHQKRMRVFSVLSLAGMVMALGAIFIFGWDATGARVQVVPDALAAFDTASAIAVVKYALGAGLCALLAGGGWMASKPGRGRRAIGEAPTDGQGGSEHTLAHGPSS